MRNSYYSKFYKETKSLFPFFGKSEKAYLRQYQSEIDTYLEEFPDSSYNDMKERIGSPKDVIFSYYDTRFNHYSRKHNYPRNQINSKGNYNYEIYKNYFMYMFWHSNK